MNARFIFSSKTFIWFCYDIAIWFYCWLNYKQSYFHRYRPLYLLAIVFPLSTFLYHPILYSLPTFPFLCLYKHYLPFATSLSLQPFFIFLSLSAVSVCLFFSFLCLSYPPSLFFVSLMSLSQYVFLFPKYSSLTFLPVCFSPCMFFFSLSLSFSHTPSFLRNSRKMRPIGFNGKSTFTQK